MRRRQSSSDSDHQNAKNGAQDRVENIRTKPPHIFDDISSKLLQLGITLSVTTFVGLIVRYAVKEFDPSVSTITVTTSRVNNEAMTSVSVSRTFLERILEFIEQSISLVAAIIPLGFPLCSLFNKQFARIRANRNQIEICDERVMALIPKYVIVGDSSACQMPDSSSRLKPLIRDTIYQLIKSNLKPKLLTEDSYDEARRMGIRIGLIRRNHHKLAVIKSVDLLKTITDSRGDIKPAKVRYLLSRLKIMSQSTPADKSFLIYLIKQCETMANENVAYLGHSFTDPEAMRFSDCAITFETCDDDDVKKEAQVLFKSPAMPFTDLYLFMIICLLSSNITQSYALYQISASVCACLYRFLSITVFQEQLISHSQFMLLLLMHQVFAIASLMTRWLSSLPQNPSAVVNATASDVLEEPSQGQSHDDDDDDISGSASGSDDEEREYDEDEEGGEHNDARAHDHNEALQVTQSSASTPNHHHSETEPDRKSHDQKGRRSQSKTSGRCGHSRSRSRSSSSHHIHMSGVDLDEAVIDSKLVTSYKQTFRNSSLVDDVTYRLAKLHIAYQLLVMIIIMVFGNTMFQLRRQNDRQHQTMALNSLIMNNIFNLANCFNQSGDFNIKSGLKSNPFFVCVLMMAVFVQVTLTETNAFGLESLNPTQWFVCFVFAILSALIAPLTGQQRRQRSAAAEHYHHHHHHHHQHHQYEHQHQQHQHQSRKPASRQSQSKLVLAPHSANNLAGSGDVRVHYDAKQGQQQHQQVNAKGRKRPPTSKAKAGRAPAEQSA